MSTNKEKDIYLEEGRLDLSILDEEIIKPPPYLPSEEPEEYTSILDELESMELKDKDISTTLHEMAMIFEKEDEYKKAFNQERLEQEKKEFTQSD